MPVPDSGPWWLSTLIVDVTGLLQHQLRRDRDHPGRHHGTRRGPGGRSRSQSTFDDDRIAAMLYDQHLFDESLFPPAEDPPTDSDDDPRGHRHG